jgi:dipeptidyl aminopeptidase/acylaminoacyl peptidase
MRKILTAAALFMLTTPARGQAPDTDIFLVSLSRSPDNSVPTGEKLVVTGARNLTKRPGYDNQPNWSPDGNTLFFTSVREGDQADIYRMNPATGDVMRVTMTSPESEYSATPIPNRNAISVVRVERDSTQRLWSVPLDGSPSTVILERIKPVGYHAWLSDTTLALFVLGSPNTLQFANTNTGRADTAITSIGRSLHRRNAGWVAFVHKVSNDEWWLVLMDPVTKQQQRWIRMPPRVEDLTWVDSTWILIGEGSVLKAFNFRAGPPEWVVVADLAQYGMTGITRLSVSPRGDALAVVAQPAAPGRDLPMKAASGSTRARRR